jgi:hypothetical protein
MVFVGLQPLVKKMPGKGNGDQAGNNHQQHEFFRQQSPYRVNRGAQHLPQTNLPGTLFRYKRSQAKQTEAGNEDGEHGKNVCQLANALFVREFFCIILIRKLVPEGTTRIVGIGTPLSVSVSPLNVFVLITCASILWSL